MVYHYTNFIVECNAWWLRRLRPLIWGTVGGWFSWLTWRYYFFGKNQALYSRMDSDEVWAERAEENKRSHGFNAHYKPDLERSMKRVLYADPRYQFPCTWTERYQGDERTLEQIMEDENERWTYYK